VPFDLFGHRERATPVPITETEPGSPAVAAFQAFTEDLRIVGNVKVDGRLSDALNRRTPLPVFAVRRGPIGSAGTLDNAPDVHELDPYDLVVVAAGPDSQPPATAERRAALRLRKTRYDVCCELEGGLVYGTVHVHPGTAPGDLVGHRPELFVPVTGADVRVRGSSIDDAALDVAFVNRAYLRAVVPVGEAPASGVDIESGGSNEGAWDS